MSYNVANNEAVIEVKKQYQVFLWKGFTVQFSEIDSGVGLRIASSDPI